MRLPYPVTVIKIKQNKIPFLACYRNVKTLFKQQKGTSTKFKTDNLITVLIEKVKIFTEK